MPELSLPAAFVDDVDVPISSADMGMFRDTAIMLDGLCYRRMNAFHSNGPQFHGPAADWHTAGDFRVWWGGLRLTTGMTTLTIEGSTAVRLDIYLNGALNTFQAAAAPFTKAITLGLFNDGDILLIEIITNGNASQTAKIILYDVYGSPVVTASTWTGVPTFAGTYNAARFNQLRDAAQYIFDRVCAIPIPPAMAHIYDQATHKVETHKLFHGSVGRYASNEVLRVTGFAFFQNTIEHYEIWYGGNLVVNSDPYGFGQVIAFSHPIVLTHTLGTRAEVEIRAVVTDATISDPVPSYKSYYTFVAIRSEADGSGYASAAPPTVFTAGESITAATLNSRLNTIATMLSAAKARLDARPELWNRARAARRVFAIDDTQVIRNMKRHCMQFIRQGDTLIVRGKGMKIGYGALTIDPPGEENGVPKPVDYTKFSFAVETSIGVNEKVTTEILRLDNLEGLELDMIYYIWGNPLEGAWEYISS